MAAFEPMSVGELGGARVDLSWVDRGERDPWDGLALPQIADADETNARAALLDGLHDGDRRPTVSDEFLRYALAIAGNRETVPFTSKDSFKGWAKSNSLKPLYAAIDNDSGRVERLMGYAPTRARQQKPTWNALKCAVASASELLHQAWVRERGDGTLADSDKEAWRFLEDREGEWGSFSSSNAATRAAYALWLLTREDEAVRWMGDEREARDAKREYIRARLICEGLDLLARMSDSDLEGSVAALQGIEGTHGERRGPDPELARAVGFGDWLLREGATGADSYRDALNDLGIKAGGIIEEVTGTGER